MAKIQPGSLATNFTSVNCLFVITVRDWFSSFHTAKLKSYPPLCAMRVNTPLVAQCTIDISQMITVPAESWHIIDASTNLFHTHGQPLFYRSYVVYNVWENKWKRVTKWIRFIIVTALDNSRWCFFCKYCLKKMVYWLAGAWCQDKKLKNKVMGISLWWNCNPDQLDGKR